MFDSMRRLRFLTLMMASVFTLGSASAQQQLTQSDFLIPPDPAESGFFANCVALNGTGLAVCRYVDSELAFRTGAVYIYDLATGAPPVKIFAPDAAANDLFGWSGAWENGYIAVGAPRDDDRGIDSGSVYIFDAEDLQFIGKVTAPNGAAGKRFGSAVAIDGNRLIVGSNDNGTPPDAGVHVFELPTLAHVRELVPDGGLGLGWFGTSLDAFEGSVVIGAPVESPNGNSSGSAYLFDYQTGQQLRRILPNVGRERDAFGHDVAIENGVIAISARLDDDLARDAGAVYLFDQATGTQQTKLIPTMGGDNDYFGYSVALNDGRLLVGQYGPAVAYLYDAHTHALLHTMTLSPDRILGANGFGYDVSLENDTAIIGIPYHNTPISQSGAVGVYDIPDRCLPDANGDGMLTPADFTAWIAAFNAQAPECDQNSDGSCTPADFTAWIANYNAGC